jgi:hypothetical protein
LLFLFTSHGFLFGISIGLTGPLSRSRHLSFGVCHDCNQPSSP